DAMVLEGTDDRADVLEAEGLLSRGRRRRALIAGGVRTAFDARQRRSPLHADGHPVTTSSAFAASEPMPQNAVGIRLASRKLGRLGDVEHVARALIAVGADIVVGQSCASHGRTTRIVGTVIFLVGTREGRVHTDEVRELKLTTHRAAGTRDRFALTRAVARKV